MIEIAMVFLLGFALGWLVVAMCLVRARDMCDTARHRCDEKWIDALRPYWAKHGLIPVYRDEHDVVDAELTIDRVMQAHEIRQAEKGGER